MNNDAFAPAIKQILFSSHWLFCCSLPISGEAPGLRNAFVFILLNVALYSVLSHYFGVWCILRQRSSPHSVRRQKILGKFLRIMQQAFFFLFCFFFFSFFEGCRAAVQFRNIRQEQMKRTCLLVGGKCQLLHIHQKCHCLFSLEVIASFSPWFWVIVEKVANRIVILKPTARLSTSAPQANLIVGKKVTCCSEIVLFNSPPPPLSTNPTVITQMLVFLFLSLFHLPSPLPFLPYLIGDFSRISAGPDGIRALQRVSVRLLLRQCDGRLRSWTGRMSRWVLFCVSLWPVSVSRVFKKKKEKKEEKKVDSIRLFAAYGPRCPWLQLQ